jgi:Fe-S-cluster containining protein
MTDEDAAAVGVGAPPSSHDACEYRPALGFRCSRCAECCRTIRVPLTGADVQRLVAAGRPTAEFTEWLSPDELDMTGEPETAVLTRAGRRFLVLAHRDGACCFLQEERCSAHSARPATCVAYPFHVQVADDADGAGADRGVHAERGAAAAPPPVIERLGGPCEPEREPEREAILAACRAVRDELGGYVTCVQEWNRQMRLRQRIGRLPLTGDEFVERLVGATRATG